MVLLKIGNILENNGFIINPYNLCVATKLVNGWMMTVVWHVEDLNASQNNSFEENKFDQYLSVI